jgi:3',5'-cyclic AMP phosphodiesterase CpdA
MPGAFAEGALIYVTNDIHYFSPRLHDDGPRYERALTEQDGKNTRQSEAILSTLVTTAIEERPDMLLINGDLTLNGELESHYGLAAALARIEEGGTRVFVIPGNHDIASPQARSFRGERALLTTATEADEFEAIYRDFGYAEAISRDTGTLSYAARPLPGLVLLMVDTNRHQENEALGYAPMGGRITEGTRAWIRSVAGEAKEAGEEVLVGMHHSLMDHHPLVHEGFTVEDDAALRELFASLGVRLVLTGHIHAQDIALRPTAALPIYDIATSALSVYPHQIGRLRWNEPTSRSSRGTWAYTTQGLDVAAWARGTGSTDPTLLAFDPQAAALFDRSSGVMVTRRAERAGITLTEAERAPLASLTALLNRRYFAGTQHLNTDLADHPGYRLLQTRRFEFLAAYLRTIMEDNPPSNTVLVIE